MLTILFIVNLMVGALVVARGRELCKKSDPNLLTGSVANSVNDPIAYTKAVGTVEFAFGIIIIVLAGLMITLGTWLTLLIGDIIVCTVYFGAFYLLKRYYAGK